MQKLHYQIVINAPVERVWNAMLDKPTYEEWTAPFSDGSTYEGSWEQGSSIKFLGPEEDGSVSGMIAEIAENRPHEFISIRHIGEIEKGQERKPEWSGQAYENYTFKPVDGGTELSVDVDVTDDEYTEMFSEMWPKALEKLKEIAERG